MPKSATKQLEEATKQLTKEHTDRKADVNRLERQQLQLTASNADLQAKNDKLSHRHSKLQKQLDQQESKIAKLHTEADYLDTKIDELDTKLADKTEELVVIRTAIAKQKSGTDRELEDYATTKKLEIKQEILNTNQELVADREELRILQVHIDEKTNQLADLNQAAIDEQEAIKVAEATKGAIIADNAKLKAELEVKTDELQEKYNKLGFDYDNALITVKKATEEHEKFIDYEKRARKVLDTKDRQLQEKEAEIGKQSIYLKNRRSNLAEL